MNYDPLSLFVVFLFSCCNSFSLLDFFLSVYFLNFFLFSLSVLIGVKKKEGNEGTEVREERKSERLVLLQRLDSALHSFSWLLIRYSEHEHSPVLLHTSLFSLSLTIS